MMVNRVKLANMCTLIYQDSSIYIRVYAVLHLLVKALHSLAVLQSSVVSLNQLGALTKSVVTVNPLNIVKPFDTI